MIHNVSNKDLIKIQDQCYAVEQLLRSGKTTSAVEMCESMVYTISMVQEEIEKVANE